MLRHGARAIVTTLVLAPLRPGEVRGPRRVRRTMVARDPGYHPVWVSHSGATSARSFL
jgi:hypothetical protein